jgi:hypothetical protein
MAKLAIDFMTLRGRITYSEGDDSIVAPSRIQLV